MNNHSLEAERAVLGAVLLNAAALDTATNILGVQDFSDSAHQLIFGIFLELEDISLLSITDYLRNKSLVDSAGGVGYVVSLAEDCPTSEGVGSYCRIIKEHSIRRSEVIKVTNFLDDLKHGVSLDAIPEFYEDAISKLKNKGVEHTDWVKLGEGHGELFKRVMDTIDGKKPYGIPTGFNSLDEKTGGMKPGELWTIGACSSHGKTTLAMQIAINSALRKLNVGFFSLEMSREGLLMYHASRMAGLDYNKVVNGEITHHENVQFAEQLKKLDDLPIDIYQHSSLTPEKLFASGTKKKFDLILLDYIQLIAQRGRQSKLESVSNGMGTAKRLALEQNCPVIILSQFTKDVSRRVGKKRATDYEKYFGIPYKSDLKETGDIENDSDVVLLLTIPSKSGNICDKDEAYWFLAKQRTGPTATMRMTWSKNEWQDYV